MKLEPPPMNKKHGILIRPDRHLISDVHAAVWNGNEIRKKLLLHDEPIVFRDVRNDTLAISGNASPSPAGERWRRGGGFELFGNQYRGNGLIIPDEGRDSPEITPEHLSHIIRFLDAEERAVEG